MSQRSYRSIGDVLTLLRAEFPDITISKIRFLESQGLVSPQRSPSGYRKFYDEDIERLRFVLVQQREHFLPLKVIRDRLNGDETIDPDGEVEQVIGKHAAGQPAATAEAPVGGAVAAARVTPPPSTSASGAESVRSTPAKRAVETPGPTRQNRVAAKEPSISDVVSALQEGPADAKGPQRRTPPERVEDVVEMEAKSVVETETLTPEEVASELDVDLKYIESLVEFGVITTVTVGGLACFDEGNVSVARIAAKFSAYGVEPRHLRQFRTSVEREVGLIDQLVSPMLRQRNPEARAKATASAKELAKLGRDMRATLIAQDLRKLFSR